MRSISPKHKKGVSELISYTLLIILAVAASVLVYNYLKVLVPKDKPSCPDGSSLIVTSVKCNFNPLVTSNVSSINITLSNKGRFTIDGAYIRIANITKSAKKLINKDQEFLLDIVTNETGLKPGVEREYSYNVLKNETDVKIAGEYSLEVQPAMIDDKTHKLAACPAFVQTITCS